LVQIDEIIAERAPNTACSGRRCAPPLMLSERPGT
jgi:hypothetical protein